MDMSKSSQQLCRVCLRKSRNLTQLSDCFIKDTSITLLEVYNLCTQLDAFVQDKLPQCLCVTCCRELQTFYDFLLRSRKTDTELRRQLNANGCSNRRKVLLEDVAEASCIETDLDLTTDRDPLEESGDEQLTPLNNLGYQEHCPVAFVAAASSDESDDEDDNKPLNVLLNEVKANKKKNEFDYYTSFSTDDGEYELSNNLTENVPDQAISTEAQIFPQGGFKCKTCHKAYFTTIGLNAHLEVHLPKTAVTKRKRLRGANGSSKRKENSVKEIAEPETDGIEIENSLNRKQKTEESEINDNKEKPCSIVEEDTTLKRKPARKEKLPKPKKMFPCHVCGKLMISASKLRYHMVMHTGEKDYLCTMCPKAYSTIYALKHHIRTHTGERPYECKFCGDKFLRPTTLKSHMRRHTGERPYGCDICGKRFIQHSSMTTHMKLNHMAKTIPCPHCEKKYARPTDLNTHLLSHTGDKPFPCQLCQSRFIRQANLNKHMNQHHTGGGKIAAASSETAKAVKSTNKSLLKSSTMDTVKQQDNSTDNITKSDALLSTSSLGGSKDSCNRKCTLNSLVSQDDTVLAGLPLLSDARDNEQSSSLLPTLFANNSATTSAFNTELNSCDLLANIPHSKPDGMQQRRQQQQAYTTDTAHTSIADLNRWNWPNHA